VPLMRVGWFRLPMKKIQPTTDRAMDRGCIDVDDEYHIAGVVGCGHVRSSCAIAEGPICGVHNRSRRLRLFGREFIRDREQR
jgi:hypothetical protein